MKEGRELAWLQSLHSKQMHGEGDQMEQEVHCRSSNDGREIAMRGRKGRHVLKVHRAHDLMVGLGVGHAWEAMHRARGRNQEENWACKLAWQ